MTAALSDTEAYRAARTGQAASAYERMRSRVPSEGTPSAKVRTRKVGFKLGAVGFTYTAKDLEVGPQAHPKAASLAGSAAPKAQTGAPSRLPEPDTSRATLARGLNAYATQVQRRLEEATPRSILLSVV